MTPHDLAVLAIGEALKEARSSVQLLERARSQALARNYAKARDLVSEAGTSASYLSQIRLGNAARGLEDCK